MKFAAAIIARFSRGKSQEPDAFEKRLLSLGTMPARRSRRPQPSLFIRAPRIA
ncbi:MAG: hypothetical protein H6897_05590 [Rhodobacteraceae bacterium]|jgi:hypothetical protein|uniref:hypothetical protein n=1 Tax=Albidovulum sp. TaxID=1872424 RepID=UPI001DDC8A1D|nr:hypothetical protein [uncultured Defluviimonas sp.]MCB2126112.1 hypothetical protein [Paracoccaceae bacterium]MCC0069388.1 hypothetical protein [Paracoccaceae bacterium]